MRQAQPSKLLYNSLIYFLMNLSILRPYVEIETIYGKLRGARALARNGRRHVQFLNIPYARPPVGELRFESPQPPFSWKGVQDALNFGNSCLQFEILTHFFTGDEDCLSLNVFTPMVSKVPLMEMDRMGKVSDANLALMPVIVYFYGGVFMSGFSYVYGGAYFMEEDVVLVTVNYRLNSFGFLNTGDGVIRGNMGLKDQVMALRWVKDNIAQFGGNPNLVTIMGQSAGGASAHHHMFSNMSSGLFHRAISMSGTAINGWAMSKYPKLQTRRLATELGCYYKDSVKMARCLKKVHPHRIARFHKEYLGAFPLPSMLYTPSIEVVDDEEAFLTSDPKGMLRRGVIPNDVPWIAGVTNAEGVLGGKYLLQNPKELSIFEETWREKFPEQFNYIRHPKQEEISSKIRQFYFGTGKIRNEILTNVSQLYSDYLFYLGFNEAISLQVKASDFPVYAYYFSYARDYGIPNILSRMRGISPRFLDFILAVSRTWLSNRINPLSNTKFGVSHADDLTTLFDIPVIADRIIPGSKDYPFSTGFVKLIVAFARDGRPGSLFEVNWDPQRKPKDHELPSLFEIGENPGVIPNPFQNGIKFWEELRKQYSF